MTKLLKWILIIVGLSVYLNIGWSLGTYYHNNVAYKSVESGNLFEKFMAGPNHSINLPDTAVEKQHSLSSDQVCISITWPFFIFIVTVCWIVYFVYCLLWLIFAGGIAKLFGLG